jgi:hypothetical protein
MPENESSSSVAQREISSSRRWRLLFYYRIDLTAHALYSDPHSFFPAATTQWSIVIGKPNPRSLGNFSTLRSNVL